MYVDVHCLNKNYNILKRQLASLQNIYDLQNLKNNMVDIRLQLKNYTTITHEYDRWRCYKDFNKNCFSALNYYFIVKLITI